MKPLPLITSAANPLVKRVRALRQRKGREQSDLFLIEGIAHLGQAAEAGWPLEAVLYAPGRLTSEFGRRLLDDLTARGVPCHALAADVFDALAEKEHPQGVLAIARRRLADLRDLAGARRLMALVAPQDPGNVGAILRTLDAVGADGLVLLDGGVDPFHPSAVRASMGALFWIPVARAAFAEFSPWARAAGLRLLGTSARSGEFIPPEGVSPPWALLLGSEQKGLSPEQLAACDLRLRLPMRGRVSSLNLAVAAGVLLYRLLPEK